MKLPKSIAPFLETVRASWAHRRRQFGSSSPKTVVELFRPPLQNQQGPLKPIIESTIAIAGLAALLVCGALAFGSMTMLLVCSGIAYTLLTQVFGLELELTPPAGMTF